MQPAPTRREFNDVLLESIDGTLTALLGRGVVDALYIRLQAAHSISKAEAPYRLDTLYSTLEKTFGDPTSKVISKAIARKLYAKLALPFSDNPGRTLLEYVEEAKVKEREKGGQA